MPLTRTILGLPLAGLLALAAGTPLAAQDKSEAPVQEKAVQPGQAPEGQKPHKAGELKASGKLHTHNFQLQAGKIYSISVKSKTFDPVVYLIDGDRVFMSQSHFGGFGLGGGPPGFGGPFGGGLKGIPVPGGPGGPVPPIGPGVPIGPNGGVQGGGVQGFPVAKPGVVQAVQVGPVGGPVAGGGPGAPVPGNNGERVAHLSFTPRKTGHYPVLVSLSPTNVVAKGPLAYTIDITEQKALLSVNDQINNNDPQYPSRPASHFKVYRVKLEANKTYQIDMTSQFDNYLFLEDATGKVLAADDDSGGNLNARIVFRPTKTDTYRVIATTFGGGATGPFTLTAIENPGAQPNFGFPGIGPVPVPVPPGIVPPAAGGAGAGVGGAVPAFPVAPTVDGAPAPKK